MSETTDSSRNGYKKHRISVTLALQIHSLALQFELSVTELALQFPKCNGKNVPVTLIISLALHT